MALFSFFWLMWQTPHVFIFCLAKYHTPAGLDYFVCEASPTGWLMAFQHNTYYHRRILNFGISEIFLKEKGKSFCPMQNYSPGKGLVLPKTQNCKPGSKNCKVRCVGRDSPPSTLFRLNYRGDLSRLRSCDLSMNQKLNKTSYITILKFQRMLIEF